MTTDQISHLPIFCSDIANIIHECMDATSVEQKAGVSKILHLDHDIDFTSDHPAAIGCIQLRILPPRSRLSLEHTLEYWINSLTSGCRLPVSQLNPQHQLECFLYAIQTMNFKTLLNHPFVRDLRWFHLDPSTRPTILKSARKVVVNENLDGIRWLIIQSNSTPSHLIGINLLLPRQCVRIAIFRNNLPMLQMFLTNASRISEALLMAINQRRTTLVEHIWKNHRPSLDLGVQQFATQQAADRGDSNICRILAD